MSGLLLIYPALHSLQPPKVASRCQLLRPFLERLIVAYLLVIAIGFPQLPAQDANLDSPPTDSQNLTELAASMLELAEERALQQAVALVAPCVVQIETFGGLERLEDKLVSEGPITGTIIDADGWIITSLHGLHQQPASILVNLPDGSRAPARIAARDYSREIALLKIDPPSPLPTASPSDPTSWQVGQWSIAVGKTYDARSVTQSYGVISALGRAYGRAVQTDAKVSPINYGGPLVDLFGRVIGILTPIPAGEMLGEDGTVLYDSGIGFAVPLTDILARLPTMQAGNDIRAGKLGVVTADANEMAGPVKLSGAAPGSPAARVGLKAGDVVVQAQGKPIEILADFRHALASVDAGQLFEFVVERSGQTIPMQCELVGEIPVYRRRYLGIQLEKAEQGLKVRAVIESSPASSAGIKVGQTLTHCDEKALQQVDELASVLAVAELEQPLRFTTLSADGQSTQEISVVPVPWPEKLIDHDPPALVSADSKPSPDAAEALQVTELRLADIPNKIHALIPKSVDSRPLGCLLVYGEPGQLTPEKLKANWEKLAVQYGWLIVFPASANPDSWTRDEIELAARLLTRLDQEYSIDSSRIAIGGIGVGGQLALMAAVAERKRVAGVWTLGTTLRRFPLRQSSSPLETLDFLLIGDAQLQTVAEQLGRVGYVANSLAAEVDASQWESVPFDALSRWLEILGYL